MNNGNNNDSEKLKSYPSSYFLYAPVNYNDNEKWNCDVSQPNSTYSFNLNPPGYIDGNPAVNFGYSKSLPWAPQVEFNPLNILNGLQNKI
mgnify:FL=1|jgi:hypothetical protein